MQETAGRQACWSVPPAHNQTGGRWGHWRSECVPADPIPGWAAADPPARPSQPEARSPATGRNLTGLVALWWCVCTAWGHATVIGHWIPASKRDVRDCDVAHTEAAGAGGSRLPALAFTSH